MFFFLWNINYFFCSRCTYIYLYIFYFSLSAFSLWGALCEEVRAPELGCTYWKYVNVAITRNLYSPKIWMNSCLYISKCVLYYKHIKYCSLTCESTESNVNKSFFLKQVLCIIVLQKHLFVHPHSGAAEAALRLLYREQGRPCLQALCCSWMVRCKWFFYSEIVGFLLLFLRSSRCTEWGLKLGSWGAWLNVCCFLKRSKCCAQSEEARMREL